MAKRRPEIAVTDPANIQDSFASGFVVQNWEDWVRVVGFTDDVTARGGDGGGEAVRRKSASLVIPRSSLPELIKKLRQSLGHHVPPARHS